MIKKHFIISIIKEARIDEKRSPFTPNQVRVLTEKFPSLHIYVQPLIKPLCRNVRRLASKAWRLPRTNKIIRLRSQTHA